VSMERRRNSPSGGHVAARSPLVIVLHTLGAVALLISDGAAEGPLHVFRLVHAADSANFLGRLADYPPRPARRGTVSLCHPSHR